eukprot:3471840-Rhodomonas_salina.1
MANIVSDSIRQPLNRHKKNARDATKSSTFEKGRILLGELGAEDAAEETLLDLSERVVVGGDHVLVVARERDLLGLEVGVVGAPTYDVSVQHHQVVGVEEEGEKLYSAQVVDVDELQLGCGRREVVELVRLAQVLVRPGVEPQVQQRVQQLRDHEQRLARVLEPDRAAVEQRALLLVLVEAEKRVRVLERLRQRACHLPEHADSKQLLPKQQRDRARELLVLFLLGLRPEERARRMPAQPLDRGLPAECVG